MEVGEAIEGRNTGGDPEAKVGIGGAIEVSFSLVNIFIFKREGSLFFEGHIPGRIHIRIVWTVNGGVECLIRAWVFIFSLFISFLLNYFLLVLRRFVSVTFLQVCSNTRIVNE